MLQIQAGKLSVGVVPDIGGSLAYFRCGAVDLMRPLSAQMQRTGNVLGVAMFPMVPYANRIAGNAFTFEGHTYRFEANNPPEKFNVHGTGWHSSWTLESHSPTETLLLLEHPPGSTANDYVYRATQHFILAPQQLRVVTSIENQSPRRMPVGFGQHPWFERDPDTTLKFTASQFWLEGPDGVATDPITTPPELDFSEGRTLPATWRNNDYGRWSGVAEIRYPSRGIGLRMEADPIFKHLMFYADPTKPYFCLEPQTNAVCAFNNLGRHAEVDLGVIVLEPGAAAEGWMTFTPFRF